MIYGAGKSDAVPAKNRPEVTEIKRVRLCWLFRFLPLKCEITYLPISEGNIAKVEEGVFSGAAKETDRPGPRACAHRLRHRARTGADVRRIAAPYAQCFEEYTQVLQRIRRSAYAGSRYPGPGSFMASFR